MYIVESWRVPAARQQHYFDTQSSSWYEELGLTLARIPSKIGDVRKVRSRGAHPKACVEGEIKTYIRVGFDANIGKRGERLHLQILNNPITLCHW